MMAAHPFYTPTQRAGLELFLFRKATLFQQPQAVNDR
jgi:hypothetical protein